MRLKSELKSELLHRKIPESEVDETTETFEVSSILVVDRKAKSVTKKFHP